MLRGDRQARRNTSRGTSRRAIGKQLAAGRTARPAGKRGWGSCRQRIIVVLAGVLAGLCAATALLFVWPRQGMPARVDAIVMLNGPGDRLGTALGLAWAHRAPMLVIARGSRYWGQGSVCAPPIPRVKVSCFDPDPPTTRGEAEFAGRLARKYHWHTIVLVTTTPQDTRARLRMGRCFRGEIYVINAPLPASEWPGAIVYEWAATIKALFFQRSC
jgi:hypothetical protein